MAFVHGYPRDRGWVMAHRRRPNAAEVGQLPLIVLLAQEVGHPGSELGRSPPGADTSSARNSAMTRS
jgi:hypothetical protein